MSRRRYLLTLPLVALACMGNTDCDGTPTSDQRLNQQQEQASSEAAMSVGFPAVRNYQEKRMMKQIIELRDQAISTTTYVMDRDAKLHFLCDSVGYGLPYATQFTSPMKLASRSCPGTGCAVGTIPQADPNGLFSPASADGTWVLCRDPNPDRAANRGTLPIYVEPHVVVSPFPLPQAAGR